MRISSLFKSLILRFLLNFFYLGLFSVFLLSPQISKSLNNEVGVDSVNIWIKRLNEKNNNYPIVSIILLNKIIDYYIYQNEYIQSAYYLNLKGNTYYKLNQTKNASESFFKALEIAQNNRDKKNMRRAMSGIGILYAEDNNFEKGLFYIFKSLDIANLLNDNLEIASANNQIGLFYYIFDNIDSAFFFYDIALQIFLEINNTEGIAATYNNIATIHHENMNIEKTIEYLNKSLVIYENEKNLLEQAFILNNKGIVYKNTKDFLKAEELFLKSIELCNIIGLYNINKKNYLYLSEIAEQKNDYKTAYYYYKFSKNIEDSLYLIENRQFMAEVLLEYENIRLSSQYRIQELELNEVNYKLEKQFHFLLLITLLAAVFLVMIIFILKINIARKKANNTLKLLNDELILKNKEIESQNLLIKEQRDELLESNVVLKEINATKNKLLEIIAHDIKNPIFNISRIINNLYIDYHSFNEDQKFKLIEIVDKSIEQLNNLLNNLLQWAKLQTGKFSINPENFNINNQIKYNIQLLNPYAEAKTISLSYEESTDLIAYADLNMFNVVMQNLIGNAIKFTNFGGEIIIKTFEENNNIKVLVEDNGIGIEPEIINNIFNIDYFQSLIGTNNEVGSGLGLKICKEFITKNSGTIKIISSLGKGSIVCFTVPYALKDTNNK